MPLASQVLQAPSVSSASERQPPPAARRRRRARAGRAGRAGCRARPVPRRPVRAVPAVPAARGPPTPVVIPSRRASATVPGRPVRRRARASSATWGHPFVVFIDCRRAPRPRRGRRRCARGSPVVRIPRCRRAVRCQSPAPRRPARRSAGCVPRPRQGGALAGRVRSRPGDGVARWSRSARLRGRSLVASPVAGARGVARSLDGNATCSCRACCSARRRARRAPPCPHHDRVPRVPRPRQRAPRIATRAPLATLAVRAPRSRAP